MTEGSLGTTGFGLYLQEMTEIPLLSVEEEKNLAQEIEKGNEEAKDKFIQANLRLVVKIARKYRGRDMDLSDLVQEGNLGLMKAVERFDWRRGYKFSTYATWWIRQTIGRALANRAKTIRIPVYVRAILYKYNQTKERLLNDFGRNPNSREIARVMGVEIEKIEELERILSLEPALLDTPIENDGEGKTTLADFIENRDEKLEPGQTLPEQEVFQNLLREDIKKVLAELTPREQEVITKRFGLFDETSHTLEQVGQEFGVTRERIRQIEAKAMRKLRHPTRKSRLKGYLDSV